MDKGSADLFSGVTALQRPRDGMTAYGRLASEFWDKISSGEWPAGTRLPTVADLAKAHGVAPVTIRGALGLLVAQGLVHSRQGRGTFVLHNPRTDQGQIPAALGESYFESWIVGPSERVEVLDRRDDETTAHLSVRLSSADLGRFRSRSAVH